MLRGQHADLPWLSLSMSPVAVRLDAVKHRVSVGFHVLEVLSLKSQHAPVSIKVSTNKYNRLKTENKTEKTRRKWWLKAKKKRQTKAVWGRKALSDQTGSVAMPIILLTAYPSIGGVVCFYIVLFMHSQTDTLRSHVMLHEWIAFYSAFLNIHWSSVLTVLAWLMPHETAAIWSCSVYTIQPCIMSLHAKPYM